MGTKPPKKNGNGSKYMKANSINQHASPTPIRDLRQLKVFFLKHLVKCQQFSLHIGNTARLSHDHAPSSECSACVSQFVWSSVYVLDKWQLLAHFYCYTKLLWVNQMQLQVLEQYLATTHIVQLGSLLLYTRPQMKKGR